MARGKAVSVDTESFIEQAKKVHGDLYLYGSTVYTGSHRKVSIQCKKHGIFFQLAHAHLAGQGCLECARIELSLSRCRPVVNVDTGHVYASQREAGEVLLVGEGVISRALKVGRPVATASGKVIHLKRADRKQLEERLLKDESFQQRLGNFNGWEKDNKPAITNLDDLEKL